MAITFECGGCGKAYTLRDEYAGKLARCKKCGHEMEVPSESDSEPYGLEYLADEAEPGRPPEPVTPAPRAPRPWPTPAPARGSSLPKSSKKKSKPNGALYGPSGYNGDASRSAIGVGLVVAVIVFRFALRSYFRGGNAPPEEPPVAPPMVVANVRGDARPEGGIAVPAFPEPGPPREIEPGVTLREVVLGPPRPLASSRPGHSGKLWLYLPSGEHAPGSLPCILITGAGSNLLTGMELGDGDRPEHLPYVRAGFAVLAFELDGFLRDKNPNDREMGEAMIRFLNARAGLVNAHVALEYVLKRVPQVDPSRISAAGHSSAGTLAVLFAEHESRLRSCVAFAPALDPEKEFGPQAVAKLRQAGVGDLVTRYSPKNNAVKLKVPLFLFHARDDSNTPIETTEAFAASLRAQGKPVTLDIVPTGDHYDSMIREGIPHAIEWLKGQRDAAP